MKATGSGRQISSSSKDPRSLNHEFGETGSGIWLQGGGQFVTDGNIMASTNGPAYGWDFDNYGGFDAWGKKAVNTFSSAATYTVKLTVWDMKGATNTTMRSVTVSDSAVNAVGDPEFDADPRETGDTRSTDLLAKQQQWAVYPNYSADNSSGWDRNASNNSLRAIVASPGFGVVNQLIRDERAHRGSQTIRFDYRNTEGDSSQNSLKFLVWGVNASPTMPKFDVDISILMGGSRLNMARTVLVQPYCSIVAM